MYGSNAGLPMAIPIYTQYCVIQELMNLLDGNTFSLWENFPFGSDVISPNQLCTCTSVQVLVVAHAVVQ